MHKVILIQLRYIQTIFKQSGGYNIKYKVYNKMRLCLYECIYVCMKYFLHVYPHMHEFI